MSFSLCLWLFIDLLWFQEPFCLRGKGILGWGSRSGRKGHRCFSGSLPRPLGGWKPSQIWAHRGSAASSLCLRFVEGSFARSQVLWKLSAQRLQNRWCFFAGRIQKEALGHSFDRARNPLLFQRCSASGFRWCRNHLYCRLAPPSQRCLTVL